MSTCATWDVLQIARDARLSGLHDVEAELLAEAAPDFEIGRCSARRPCPKFILDEHADEYEDREPIAEQVIAARRRIDSQDWLAWYTPRKLGSFDALMREMYTPAAVEHMAFRPNPAYGMLRRERDGDGFEARIRSYANIIQPVSYGVFKVDE